MYVPVELYIDEVEDYLNDKLETEPEFFGYIDQGCFEQYPEDVVSF